MNENDTNKPSETNLDLFDSMTDDMIDTSDIPPLSAEFFDNATWRRPEQLITVSIEIEPDVLEWFREQGEDYGTRLSAALRLYVAAHKSFARERTMAS